MDKTWLTEKILPEEFLTVEEANMSEVPYDRHRVMVSDSQNRLPFGDRYFTWERMKLMATLDNDAAIWKFRSPEHTWIQLAGRAGYVLVKSGFPLPSYAITTTMS